MNSLGSLLRIGETRTDSIGNLRFPNFNLLIEIAKESQMDFDKAISLIEINDNTLVRVKKEGEGSVIFSIKVGDKFEIVAQHPHLISSYKDEKHQQVRGGGYIEWINKDFENKFDAELILKCLGWNSLKNYLLFKNISIDSLDKSDELLICSYEKK